MTPSILLTQCLQNDFVRPIGAHDPLPNKLHVGYKEALRLLGEQPYEGPVARIMEWAHAAEHLKIIHLRDWHDTQDPAQKDHLQHFGEPCLSHTEGAAFAFRDPDEAKSDTSIIDSLTLNDFQETGLEKALNPQAGSACRIGIIGVWTEAKISFLAYELKTRYPTFEIAVCSALCASSTRQHHFQALDQMQRILGVRVIDSVGEFIEYLGGSNTDVRLRGFDSAHPQLRCAQLTLNAADESVIRYLFRDCKHVDLRILDGGFLETSSPPAPVSI